MFKNDLAFYLHQVEGCEKLRTIILNLYEANISLMCSNMEQITTLIGNLID